MSPKSDAARPFSNITKAVEKLAAEHGWKVLVVPPSLQGVSFHFADEADASLTTQFMLVPDPDWEPPSDDPLAAYEAEFKQDEAKEKREARHEDARRDLENLRDNLEGGEGIL